MTEQVWVSVSIRNSRKLIIGSFYRPPSSGPAPVKALEKELEGINQPHRNNKNATILLGGDFNVPHINWDTRSTQESIPDKATHDALLTALADNHLTQVQKEPTRLGNILDLMCTNKPGLVKSVITIPGISDHEVVVTDSNLKPEYNLRKPHERSTSTRRQTGTRSARRQTASPQITLKNTKTEESTKTGTSLRNT